MSEKAIAAIKIAISLGLIAWTFSRLPLAVSLLVQLIERLASLPGGYFWLRNRREAQPAAQPVAGGSAF